MSLTVENGEKEAQRKAAADMALYKKAKGLFNWIFEKYHSDVPISLGLGHLLSVNRNLSVKPPVTRDQRRGFLLAPRQIASNAGVPWENLDDTNTCTYIWYRDINGIGKYLHENNPTLFTSPNEDFWKCVYLQHRLGLSVFKVLWNSRDTSQSSVYNSLLYAVSNITRQVAGLSPVELRKLVFSDCAYVFILAKKEVPLQSTGYGIEPVLTRVDTLKTFTV